MLGVRRDGKAQQPGAEPSLPQGLAGERLPGQRGERAAEAGGGRGAVRVALTLRMVCCALVCVLVVQVRVKTWFNQPGKKRSRRLKRDAKVRSRAGARLGASQNRG